MKNLKTVLICILTPALLLGGFLGYSMLEQKTNDQRAEDIVRPKAEAYLQEQYPDMDLEITECSWSWYSNRFEVKVQSSTDRDTHFSLIFSTKETELKQDSFVSEVSSDRNT